MGAQQIMQFANAAGATINIIDQYGQIDSAMLSTACQAFCSAGGAQFQQRARQNNTMMGECILATLTPAARIRLLPFRMEFEINDFIFAPLLHKKVMQIATIFATIILIVAFRFLKLLPSNLNGNSK